MSTVQTPLHPRFAPLATGVTLQYVESGDPTGIPVVFLHGYYRLLAVVRAATAAPPGGDIRAIALTLRGHGDADRPATGYSHDDFAADVAAFLADQDLEQAVIVGHSLGSSIAQRFAIDHPERCLGLVLIGASTMWTSNPGVMELSAFIASMEDPVDPAFVHEFQASTVVRPVPDSLIATAVAESLKVPARVWREALASHLEADYTDELGGITVPTLLLAGGRDDLTPYEAQLVLQALIPGSRLINYPDGGHAVHWEDPAQVAADIATFVRALPS